MNAVQQVQLFQIRDSVQRIHVNKIFAFNSMLDWTECGNSSKHHRKTIKVGKALGHIFREDLKIPEYKAFREICPASNRLNFMQFCRVINRDKTWKFITNDQMLSECLADYARTLPEKHRETFWSIAPFVYYNCSVSGSCQITNFADNSIVIFGQ